MKRQTNNKVYYPNLILVITGITIILFGAYSIISLGLIRETKATVLNSLENEYYVVGKEPTPYQKEVFLEINDQLNQKTRDYKKIRELVAKSFVIDFFGWSNKDSAYDIGGLQYMKDPKTFNDKAHWEYYQKLDVFNSTYGKGKLPSVKAINVDPIIQGRFILGNQIVDAYKVSLDWSYDYTGNLNIKDFVKSAELTLINENGKIVIVEVKMIKEVAEDE